MRAHNVRYALTNHDFLQCGKLIALAQTYRVDQLRAAIFLVDPNHLPTLRFVLQNALYNLLGCIGICHCHPDSAVKSRTRLLIVGLDIQFTAPPLDLGGQGLELLGRHSLDDLVIELRHELAGAIDDRLGALEPALRHRPFPSRRNSGKVCEPHAKGEHNKHKRQHRRHFELHAAGEPEH